MARRPKLTDGTLPHKRYGVDLSKVVPDYIEPFTAYRAWQWDEDGIASLNNVRWTPKVAHVAACSRGPVWLDTQRPVNEHESPNTECTCGIYAGINLEHLSTDTDYAHRGIHGEVHLWGRVYVHSLGWRAQYAYPKFFVVPPNMLPFTVAEIQRRLESLIKYDCDIYLQKDLHPSRTGEKIPLWVKDYGYSQQGIGYLLEQASARQSESVIVKGLQVGDRVCVLGDDGGIGIVKIINDREFYYTLFNPNIFYRKRVKDVKWSDRNWRWETTGRGFVSGTVKSGFDPNPDR
jgi:hypothetical protein